MNAQCVEECHVFLRPCAGPAVLKIFRGPPKPHELLESIFIIAESLIYRIYFKQHAVGS